MTIWEEVSMWHWPIVCYHLDLWEWNVTF